MELVADLAVARNQNGNAMEKKPAPQALPLEPYDYASELLRLAPPETSTPQHVASVLDYLEARMEAWKQEQNERLRKAEKRIKLCASIRGAMGVLGFDSGSHFSWCPYDHWISNDFLPSEDLQS